MGIWKHAICNETFEGWDHARVCSTSAALGYEGLEVAPFTLAPRIGQVDAETRRRVRSTAENAGLKIIGLHWLRGTKFGLVQRAIRDGENRTLFSGYATPTFKLFLFVAAAMIAATTPSAADSVGVASPE